MIYFGKDSAGMAAIGSVSGLKYEKGTFTLTSSVATTQIPHTLGVNPLVVVIWPDANNTINYATNGEIAGFYINTNCGKNPFSDITFKDDNSHGTGPVAETRTTYSTYALWLENASTSNNYMLYNSGPGTRNGTTYFGLPYRSASYYWQAGIYHYLIIAPPSSLT